MLRKPCFARVVYIYIYMFGSTFKINDGNFVKEFVLVLYTDCVFCDVRTDLINVIHINGGFRMLYADVVALSTSYRIRCIYFLNRVQVCSM